MTPGGDEELNWTYNLREERGRVLCEIQVKGCGNGGNLALLVG